MKWLLTLSILIIFSIGTIHAEPEDDDDSCFEQLTNERILIQSCRSEILNDTSLRSNLEETIIQYSGDNDAVHTLADKYCPILREWLKCQFVANISVECLIPNLVAEDKRQHDLLTAILNYMCANSGLVLVRILESNGLKTVYNNKQFYKCVTYILDAIRISDDTTNNEICSGVDNGFQCYIDFVQDHENLNLVPIANELKGVFHQSLNCQYVNELLIN